MAEANPSATKADSEDIDDNFGDDDEEEEEEVGMEEDRDAAEVEDVKDGEDGEEEEEECLTAAADSMFDKFCIHSIANTTLKNVTWALLSGNDDENEEAVVVAPAVVVVALSLPAATDAEEEENSDDDASVDDDDEVPSPATVVGKPTKRRLFTVTCRGRSHMTFSLGRSNL